MLLSNLRNDRMLLPMTSSVASQPMTDVEVLLKEYRGDVNIAVSSFYAGKTINKLAASDQKVFCVLNRNALSWRIIVHSLQVTFFAALGRIFDRDARSVSVHGLLGVCKKEITQFSKLALEARKLKEANGVRPEWLSDYLQGVYEADTTDFDALAQILCRHEETYTSKYQPIRHKVIAHNDLTTIGFKDALFSTTNIAEVEEILEFLHQVERVVAELHVNGRKTSLTQHTLDEERYVREDLEKLLAILPATNPNERDSQWDS